MVKDFAFIPNEKNVNYFRIDLKYIGSSLTATILSIIITSQLSG